MSRSSALLALLVVALGACRSASLSLDVRNAQRGRTLRAFVFAPGEGFSGDCDAISFADVTLDTLASSLVIASPLEDSGDLGAVPREGRKIIVVEEFANEKPDVATAFGCAEVGALDADRSVEVSLAPTAHVDVVNGVFSLAADLAADDTGAVNPAPAIIVRDAGDALAIGHDVRVRVLFGNTVLDERIVPYQPPASAQGDDATSAMTVPIDIARAGPFAVELRARAQLQVPLPLLPGLALPKEDSIDPFAGVSPRPPVIVAGPLGFVGVGGPLHVAAVDVTPGKISFVVTSPLPTLAPPAVAVPTFGVDAHGGGERLVAVVALADSTLALVTQTDVIAQSPPIANVCAALPIGECRFGPDAIPLLVSATDANNDCTAFAFVDDDGAGALTVDSLQVTTSPLRGLGVRFSLCTDDAQGNPHRFLVAGDPTVAGAAPVLVDVTLGLDGPHEDAPDLGTLFAATSHEPGSGGDFEIIAARFAGTAIAVGPATLALSQPALLPGFPLFNLPAPPNALFASSTAVFALMTPSPAQPTIFAMSEGNVVGLHALTACGPGVACRAFATHDGDVLYTAGASAHFISFAH